MYYKYSNMTWAGFFCYLFDSAKKKKFYFFFVFAIFLALYNYKTIVSSYDYMESLSTQADASKLTREISNLKSAISERNEHTQNLAWLYDLSNLENLPLIDKEYLFFRVNHDGDIYNEHTSRNGGKFLGVFDADKEFVSIVPENNGFSIQLNNKNSNICNLVLNKMDDLSSITINSNTINTDDLTAQKKYDICHISQKNDIKFTFSK